MLSGLGHLVGGPSVIIESIQVAVSNVTIMMPTFPFDGTMEAYLSTDPVFDPKETPSRSGLLSEILRLTEGARRSLHPTHPCAALGPRADELIVGSELSRTPFGNESTYGRLSRMKNAYLLLVHTNNSSIVHRVQEMVRMPNLFRDAPVAVRGLASGGEIQEYSIFTHTPTIPLYVIVEGDRAGDLEYVWMPDYTMPFPGYNRARILSRLQSDRARTMLLDRQDRFVKDGIVRTAQIRDAEISLVHLEPWLETICRDLRESIDTFSEEYRYENMKAARDRGLLGS